MYIQDNAELHSLIPNVMREITGETTLFAKITPFISEVEEEFDVKVKGDATIPTGIMPVVKRYVANESFRRAIPSLDLILTPNGFGVVSNTNVAPASKERVENLRRALNEAVNHSLSIICRNLISVQGAAITALQKMSIFPNIDIYYVVCNTDEPKDILLEYEKLQNRFSIRENLMAEKYVSQELMAVLRARARGESTSNDTDADTLLRMMSQIEIRDARKTADDAMCQPLPAMELRQMVDMIRHSSFKSTWEASATGLAWNVERFENTEKSGGYWL